MEEKPIVTNEPKIKDVPTPGARMRIKWEYILIVILMIPTVLYVMDYLKSSTEVKQEPQVEEVKETPKQETQTPKPNDEVVFTKGEFGTTIKDWKKPEAGSIGIVFDNSTENKAYLYQKNTDKVTLIPNAKGNNSGSSDFGEVAPISSPDRMYSVYIGKEGYLYLLSNATFESVRISEVPIALITGWMGDSTRVIYYVDEDNIISRTDGPGIDNTREQFEKNNRVSGFYLFDIENGKTVYLYPVNNVKSIIGSDRVLVNINQDNGSYVVFNVDNFDADYKIFENTGKDINGLNQIVTTEKGDKWSYLYSFKAVGDSNILYADYPVLPNNDGTGYTFVEQGPWATYQWPKFSLDESMIMFIKDAAVLESEVYVYNIADKTSKKVTSGFDAEWIDNENILVRDHDSYDAPVNYFVVNITTGNRLGLSLP